MRSPTLGLMLAALLATGGCASEPAAPSYRQAVLQHRMQRDMDMRSTSSVLTREARERFKGLRFFPVDSTYRFTTRLERAASPDTVWMPESTGGLAAHLRVGTVELPFPEGTARLAVFRTGGAEQRLWIPFADRTNGTETYSGGRYVDLHLEGETAFVDFNKAYNPTCDYNPDYACPLPPEENALPFPVPAGEKKSLLHTY